MAPSLTCSHSSNGAQKWKQESSTIIEKVLKCTFHSLAFAPLARPVCSARPLETVSQERLRMPIAFTQNTPYLHAKDKCLAGQSLESL